RSAAARPVDAGPTGSPRRRPRRTRTARARRRARAARSWPLRRPLSETRRDRARSPLEQRRSAVAERPAEIPPDRERAVRADLVLEPGVVDDRRRLEIVEQRPREAGDGGAARAERGRILALAREDVEERDPRQGKPGRTRGRDQPGGGAVLPRGREVVD